MTDLSRIEFRNMRIAADIGTYGPGDVVPDAHWLGLILAIDPSLVLIDRDEMDLVFDYAP